MESTAYQEIVDFIASGPDAEHVAAFRPSPSARQRVLQLLERQKNGELLPRERAELEHYLQLEHLMRLARARARLNLAA